jgi:hypothetical protein
LASNSLTILSSGTFVRGDLFSEDILVVEGGIEGNILGNRVIIKPTGWVHGDLSCRSLSIEPGGVVDGAVKVTTKPALPAGQAQPDSLPHAEAYSLPEGELANPEEPPEEEPLPEDEPLEEAPPEEEAAEPEDQEEAEEKQTTSDQK